MTFSRAGECFRLDFGDALYLFQSAERDASIRSAVFGGLREVLRQYPKDWQRDFSKLCRRIDVMVTGSLVRHCVLSPGEPFTGGDLDFVFSGRNLDLLNVLFDLSALGADLQDQSYGASSAWDISPRRGAAPFRVQLFGSESCWGPQDANTGVLRYLDNVTYSIDTAAVGVGRAQGVVLLGEHTYADWHSRYVRYNASPIFDDWTRRRAVRYALQGYNLGRDVRYDLAEFVHQKGIQALFVEYQGTRKPHEPQCSYAELETSIFEVR